MDIYYKKTTGRHLLQKEVDIYYNKNRWTSIKIYKKNQVDIYYNKKQVDIYYKKRRTFISIIKQGVHYCNKQAHKAR